MFPKDLRSSEISKYQGDLKASWNYSLELCLRPKFKILSILAKKFSKLEI